MRAGDIARRRFLREGLVSTTGLLSGSVVSASVGLAQRGPGYDPVTPELPPLPEKRSYAGIHRHTMIYYDAYAYSSWPSIVMCKDEELLIAFSSKTRRKEAITHVDPSIWNLITRSANQGGTWSTPPEIIGDYSFFGVDDPGIMQLSDGRVLVNACQRVFASAASANKRTDKRFIRVEPFQWAYASARDKTFVFHSLDNAQTWLDPVRIDVNPFRSGWTLRPIVELPDGTLLLPCYEEEYKPSGEGMTMSAFVMRSRDRGRNWVEPTLIAGQEKIGFNEPALLCLTSGKVIALMRTAPAAWLYQSESEDGGRTWTQPAQTPMWGYPADLRMLRDGRILASYGHRRPPYGIRACLSEDQGRTWQIKREVVLRDDFPNADLGYPTTCELRDGTLLTVYYGRDTKNDVTCIQGTYWRLSG